MSARSIPIGQIRPLGDHAWIIGVRDAVAARRLTRVITASGLPGVAEVVGGLATVMVSFESEGEDAATCLSELTQLVHAARRDPEREEETGRLLEIPCVFDGPDLAEVATLARCTSEAVIALLVGRLLTVATVGFSPGFAYLAGLPEELRHVPRRPRPRPTVPAGSVALANGHAAVYPTASPGGWQLIGRTNTELLTPAAPPYVRLVPGDQVRFTSVGRLNEQDGHATGEGAASNGTQWLSSGARPVFDVEEPGFRTVLQDGGRRGVAALGIPAAGPGDPTSFRLANRLVGNPPESCALEITARGPTLHCLRSTFVAVVGASPDLRLQDRPVAAGRVIPVEAGQRLIFGPTRIGFRSYLAIAGGFVGPKVFGSCASDQLSALGPGPVSRGGRLWASTMELPMGDHLVDTSTFTFGLLAEPIALRVVPGPHQEMFTANAFASLASSTFTVADESNRVGIRLRGDPSVQTIVMTAGADTQLDSQGMVTGAVQVPPDGEPVILLTDHATLGGYPVLAVVATVDLGRLGQCAPGSVVALVPTDFDEASRALREHRRLMDSAVIGHYPLAVD